MSYTRLAAIVTVKEKTSYRARAVVSLFRYRVLQPSKSSPRIRPTPLYYRPHYLDINSRSGIQLLLAVLNSRRQPLSLSRTLLRCCIFPQAHSSLALLLPLLYFELAESYAIDRHCLPVPKIRMLSILCSACLYYVIAETFPATLGLPSALRASTLFETMERAPVALSITTPVPIGSPDIQTRAPPDL